MTMLLLNEDGLRHNRAYASVLLEKWYNTM